MIDKSCEESQSTRLDLQGYPDCIQKTSNEELQTCFVEIYDMVDSTRFLVPSSSGCHPENYSCPIDKLGKQKGAELAHMIANNQFIKIPERFEKYRVGFGGLARAAIWSVENNAIDSLYRDKLFEKLEKTLTYLSDDTVVTGFRRHQLDIKILETLFAQEANHVGSLTRYISNSISFMFDPQRENIVTFRVWNRFKYDM